MPLSLRTVVPYTLPGVLALIGWWWYIARKKERITSHDSQEGAPTTVGLSTSPTEGSNGLVEKGTISPTNDMGTPTQQQASRDRPAKVKGHRSTEQEVVAQIHLPDTKASASQEHSSGVAAPDRVRTEEIQKASDSALEESSVLKVSAKHRKDPETSLATEPEKHTVKDLTCAAILPCQSAQFTQVIGASPTEWSEPEGEVDLHTTITTKDELVLCAVTPAKAQSTIPPEAYSLERPTQSSFDHMLTSTPNSPAPAPLPVYLTPKRDSTTTAAPPEDGLQDATSTAAPPEDGLQDFTSTAAPPEYCLQDSTSTAAPPVEGGLHDFTSSAAPPVDGLLSSGEEQDLERLAAGLITEVISVATQEVLCVARCQDRDSGFVDSKLTEREEQGMSNGCSSVSAWEPIGVSRRGNELKNAQIGHWPPTSHQAAQSAPLPNLLKLRGDEGAALTEDSACSTCHSEDDLHTMDLLRLTDMSAEEATLPQALAETSTENLAGASAEEAVCDMKRLNGMGLLRNGAQGTSEAETDQSGGSDVNSMDSVDSGCTMGAGDSQSNHATASGSELVIWEIEVPKHLVGRLIGKQGRYVSYLKQNSGAKIYISTLPYTQEFQICHIEGTQQQVDKALSLIGKKFKDLDLTNLYAPPPPPLTLPSLPMTSWLLLPSGVTVEVIVVNIVSAGHIFVQQHTHPTYHALRSLDQQMFLCYSQPGTPALPSPAEVGVICAAPAVEGAWWRAQVITFYKETNEVEIRYVDYGGYDRVKIDSLRQIRSDFVTLPFQGAEVLLDNIAPLPGEDRFSAEATSALEELTRGVALLAQVSNYDNNTGLPLVQLWNMLGDELVLVNRTLAERGMGVWVDGF